MFRVRFRGRCEAGRAADEFFDAGLIAELQGLE